MRIVVNHLTRMNQPERICVAGVDEQSREHVRPVSADGTMLTRQMLREAGGCFELGALVDLGPAVPRPAAPEIEDHTFRSARATYVRRLDPNEYLNLLFDIGESDLFKIFGAELVRATNWKYGAPEGRGTASLGVLLEPDDVALELNPFDERKLQVRLSVEGQRAFARVTDLRFYEADHRTLRLDRIKDVQRRIDRGVPLVLMVGLSRAYPRRTRTTGFKSTASASPIGLLARRPRQAAWYRQRPCAGAPMLDP